MKLKDLSIYDIGNKLGLVGAIFGDDDKAYMLLFPGQEYEPPAEILELSYEDWKAVIRQTDLLETEVMQRAANGKLVKAILRKTQRLIEQRVSWAVFKRDGYQCRYCGADGVPLTVDHLVLWEELGPSVEENLLTSCRKCNKTRGRTQYSDWLAHPYYQRVSQNLTEAERAENIAVLATLDRIPRRHTERRTRK